MEETPPYASALVKLLHGVVYPDDSVWELILLYETPIANYFAYLGVELVLSKGEYAYLTQPKTQDGETDLFRLIPSRSLNLYSTVLLVILREYVLDHENKQQEGVPIISRTQILDRLNALISDHGSSSRFEQRIDTAIEDARKHRFLRDVAENEYEIRALIKAKIPAEKIAGLLDDMQQAFEA
jgi:hypothetical protein